MEVKELKTLVKLVKGKKPKSLSETKTKTHSEPYLLAKVIRGSEKPKFGKEDEMVVVSSSDLVIISDGDAGEVFQGLSGGLASTMSKIEPLENINLKYLKYFLISNRKLFSDTRTGAAIPHLNKDVFFNLQIPVPSLQEQEKIVERLDELFENTDKIISNNSKTYIETFKLLKSFFISKKNDIDFDIKSLSEISENLDSVRKPIKKDLREKGDIPYYGATGLIDYVKDFIFDEKLLLISEDGANLLDRKYPIAFSIEGKSWVNNHAHVLRFKNIELQIYVMFYFNFSDISNFITGAAQPKLNQQKLNSIEIPTPKNEKNLKYFVNKFQQIHLICSNYNQNINSSDEMYSNLIRSVLKKEFSYE